MEQPPTIDNVSARLRKVQMTSHNNEMAATQAPPGDDLSVRLNKIPQELQDDIFEITIAIRTTRETGAVVTITKEWRPPWQMQINKASRKRVAKRYYSDNIFTVPPATTRVQYNDNMSVARAWIDLLPAEHTGLIKQFRIPQLKPRKIRYSSCLPGSMYTELSRIALSTTIMGLQLDHEHLMDRDGRKLEHCLMINCEVEVDDHKEGKAEELTGDGEGGGRNDCTRFETKWCNLSELKAMLHDL